MNDTDTMRRFSAERVGLAIAALIGLLPSAHALFTHHVFGGEAAVGLLLTAFCFSQLLRAQD
jgi:hypothetical protein